MQEDLTHRILVEEDDILLDEAALALARLDNRETDLSPYCDVLAAIAIRLAAVADGATSADARAAALASVLADASGFAGDRETYDDPDNADLIRVIDRRRGLPISLSILQRVGSTGRGLC